MEEDNKIKLFENYSNLININLLTFRGLYKSVYLVYKSENNNKY